MKIALVGPGIIPIPPDGWGAVESLIHETSCELSKLGYEVRVFNTTDLNLLIKTVVEFNPRFVHLFYDKYFQLLDQIQVHLPLAKLAISSAYPYIDQKHKHDHECYHPIFSWLINQRSYYNFCMSIKDMEAFVSEGVPYHLLRLFSLGAPHNRFRFETNCPMPGRSLYLARIEPRKRQYVYQPVPSIDFVGPDTGLTSFNPSKNYLGEWRDQEKFYRMTDYANLVLLSDGENGTPLAVKEALVAGLGVVVSKYAAHDLDTSLPFIDVVDDHLWNDISYVEAVIAKNREVATKVRPQIRAYGVSQFSWEVLTRKYEKDILALL